MDDVMSLSLHKIELLLRELHELDASRAGEG
jgi:hypothetical protein